VKVEPKVAWEKTHPINPKLVRSIRQGKPIDHALLIRAVGDPDRVVVFGDNTLRARKKADYVIFQYGVVLRDASGRVATFVRANLEQGQKRITEGRSMILSASNPDPPQHALSRLVQQQVCVGGRACIGGFRPMGMLWNELPVRDGNPQPTYIFALYEHTLPDLVRLHGRFKESPDQRLEWFQPGKLASAMSSSGYADQVLAGVLDGESDTRSAHVVYSRKSVLRSRSRARGARLEYSSARNVFISHAAEDSFSAYALYRILLEESSRAIYPTLDLESLQDGDSLTRIEREMIAQCDCLVLIITPTLIEKARRMRRRKKVFWVEREVELARNAGKHIIGFKLGTTDRPDFLRQDLIANDRSFYCDWLSEVQRLIKSVQSRFSTAL
jgi:hypothetical protein